MCPCVHVLQSINFKVVELPVLPTILFCEEAITRLETLLLDIKIVGNTKIETHYIPLIFFTQKRLSEIDKGAMCKAIYQFQKHFDIFTS